MKHVSLITAFLLAVITSYSQSWENVGSGLGDKVYDLQPFQGKLYAGGRIGVAFWNDTSWTSLPNPVGIAYPLTFAIYDDTLYVGGDFPWSGSISHVYKYNGTGWGQVGGDFDEALWSSTKQLLTSNGQLISGGHYTSINGSTINNIASWNGQTWNSLGEGLNGAVWKLAEHNGQLFASGDFTASGSDTTVKHIAKWDGTNWLPLDTTFSLRTAGAMISFDSMLIIGNVWDTIGGIPMKGIAAWNGTTFTSRGNNLIRHINNFGIFNNDLYLCGDLYTLNQNDYANVVLKWNGFFWQQVGVEFDQPVLTIDDFNNQLFCGGFYTSPASYIAKFDTTIGIFELDGDVAFQIYPNPASEIIILSTTERGTITVTNQVGQFIDEVSIKDNHTQFSTEKLLSGIYFLTFRTEKYLATRKLVIQK